MYTQFGASQNAKLNDALKVLNSDADEAPYQGALRSALEVLTDSYPLDGKKLEWVAEVLSAYKKIGKSLAKYLGAGNLPSEELGVLEREFSGVLSDYTTDNFAGNMRLILSDLNNLSWESIPDNLPEDKAATVTNRVISAFEDYKAVREVMNQHEIEDEKDLEIALKERSQLREQMGNFERSL